MALADVVGVPAVGRTLNGGKISLLEAGHGRLEPPSGGRPGLVKHQVGGTRLNALAAKLAGVLDFDGCLHDFSEGVSAALEDVRPQHLVHPHFLVGSSMDGLLGIVVFDEVDGEPVLMIVRHGDGWPGRDRWVVSQRVRELDDLYFAKFDDLFLVAFGFLDVGDGIADDGGGIFFLIC